MFKSFSMDLAGRTLTVEVGRVAKQANGAAFMHYGDTVVLSTATASDKPRDGIDFFPLSVEFEEKLYAVGKIPGGFTKREGKASENAVLTARVIDRPMRPLFPKDYRNDVTLDNIVMSVDPECSPELTAMLGSAIATSISDIPFDGPCATTQVGLIDGEFIINPTAAQKKVSDLTLTVASTREKVIMIEAGANEVPEDTMIEAIFKADEVNKEIIAFIDKIVAECGKEKHSYESCAIPEELFAAIREIVPPEEMEEAVFTDDKQTREENIRQITERLEEAFAENEEWLPLVGDAVYQYQKKTVRKMILKDHKRPDGRKIDEIRPLAAEVDLLPRVHGSGMFTRGQTQILNACTLAPLSEAQRLDGLDENETTKRYMHHYNFPSFSVGETKPSRGPGRREIGHGALAERALLPVLPSEEEFPYAIRVVSEVMESNGSSSMASTCGSTLALMDGGVPIKRPVSGIAMGLIQEEGKTVVLSDIQGLEDFLGDMDFKVTGTTEGITALQMDNKATGLTFDILARALQQAKEGRAFILQKMLDVIPEPRHTTRSTAPRIVSIQVPTDKIRDVIGSGGKVIRGIQDETGASVDIQEDGTVFVGGTGESVDQAVERIKLIIKVPEPGEEYTGRVVSIQPFGAFVNLLPGKDGLLHISRVAKGRVEKVEDVLNVGDEVKVVVIEVDDRGKISLDRLDKPEAPARAEGASEGDGEHFQRRERPRRERSERSDRPRRPGDNGGRKPRRHHDAE